MGHPEDRWVYCVKCKKERVAREEIEEGQRDSWVCRRCQIKRIGIALLDFIKRRISVTRTEDEDRSKFILRELIQNADDVRANILVLKFEKENLWVANDGSAFTSEDFKRISTVLGRHQAEDKETAGHFGSGFQTVYAITNNPEVHSNGISGRMDPFRSEWDYEIERLKSPYIHKDSKGALFRLLWRTDAKAEEVFDGVRPFSDRVFPRWDETERREFFEDLKGYLHQAILCCQHLRSIRLIWGAEGEYEGYQVERDWRLNSVRPQRIIGKVAEGSGRPSSDWETSFQIENWIWDDSKKEFCYLIASRYVTTLDGGTAFVGTKRDRAVIVTTDHANLEKELMKNNVFLLFPLFDSDGVFRDGRAFLYSVIPLPKRSRNKFAFTGHFFPMEDRKDVDVADVYGEWYRLVMLNVALLYRESFPLFVRKVQSLGMSGELQQKIILNAIPGVDLYKWMRPDKEENTGWWEAEWERIVDSVVNEPILHTGGQWIRPKAAYSGYIGGRDVSTGVIRLLGKYHFTEAFVSHPHFQSTLNKKLEECEFDEETFLQLWKDFMSMHTVADSTLEYGQRLDNGQTLNKDAIKNLIDYCLIRPTAKEEIKSSVIIPGADRILRPLNHYPVPPEGFEDLERILPKSRLIHDDFRQSMRGFKPEGRKLDLVGVTRMIHEAVEQSGERFKNMRREDHELVSKIVKTLVLQSGFALSDEMKDYKFIPYRHKRRVSLGTPNKDENGELIKGAHLGEDQLRDSIFATQPHDFEGLTSELRARISFLYILGCTEDELSLIEKKLLLVKLKTGVATNFIRHFLSPKHGSLFEDANLKKFLETSDKAMLQRHKMEFLKALKSYFSGKERTERYLTPSDMARVPCLYDEKREWHNAVEFTIEMYLELEALGFRALHHHFRDWPRDTLLALGVNEIPNADQVLKKIAELSRDKYKNRKVLADLAVYLITSDLELDLSKMFIDVESGRVAAKDWDWIPTIESGFRKPGEVVLPTKENVEVLGEEYGSFLDYESCSEFMREKAEEIFVKKEGMSIKNLEFKELKYLDLIPVVDSYKKRNEEPPPKLFDKFNSLLPDIPPEAIVGHSQGHGYYYESKWYESSQIVIADERSLPEDVRGHFLVIPSGRKHTTYLMWDGVGTKIRVEYLFSEMVENRIEPTEGIWNYIEQRWEEIDAEHRSKFGNQGIYPISEHQIQRNVIITKKVKPYKVIFKDERFFSREGFLGEYYVIEHTRHIKALKALGAKGKEDLDITTLLSITRSMRESEETIDDLKVESVLLILKLINKKDPNFKLPDERLWPVNIEGMNTLEKVGYCYIKDSPFAWYFKEEGIPFLTDEIGKARDEDLRNLGERSGAKSFRNSLELRTFYDEARVSEDQDQMIRLRELGKALRVAFSKDLDGRCFSWLENAEAKRCPRIAVECEIGEIKKIIEDKSSMMKEEGSKTIFYIQRHPTDTIYNDLTNDICAKCINEGFPNDETKTEKLKTMISKLLPIYLEHWKWIIEGYHFEGERSPGLIVDEGIEASGRGYLEVREKLQEWYGCCQICGSRTPMDEEDYETSEKVKSIVSTRGGMYAGSFEKYDVGNCLFLCPTHHTLFERGLIEFDELPKQGDNIYDKAVVQRLKEKIEAYESEIPEREMRWGGRVFEGRRGSDGGGSPVRASWRDATVVFRTEHLLGFLKKVKDYFEENW